MEVLFKDMGLSENLLKAIKDIGFEEATPIQAQTYEIIKQGRDVIGQAHTGSGKTLAFGIPTIEKVNSKLKKPQAIILCPTRELAIQVSEEIRKLITHERGLFILPIYGGQPIERQIRVLKKGVQIIVGTPGRIVDHIKRGTIDFSNIETLVLDEADEMLDMGFLPDMEFILNSMPDEKQTLLFSATLSKEIFRISKRFLTNPETIKVTPKEITVPNIEQYYIETPESSKLDALCRIFDVENPRLALVFCNTKRKVNETVSNLQARNYFADALHGDMKQETRDQVMKKFRKGTIDILVATDVAARGLDVDEVDVVFNYDLPLDDEQYVHRIGRTARAGRNGKAYSFIVRKEIYQLRNIQRYTKVKLSRTMIPSLKDVEAVKARTLLEDVQERIQGGNLDKYVNLLQSLVSDDYNLLDIGAALLEMQLDKNGNGNGNQEDDVDAMFENTGARPGMVKFYVNAGRNDNFTVPNMLEIIYDNTNVPKGEIGKISLFDRFSFVEIPRQYAKDVYVCSNQVEFKKRSICFQVAKPRN